MANLKKTDMLGALNRYIHIINQLPVQIVQNLFNGLESLHEIGVIEYGKRVIYPNGKSFILTTSKRWCDEFDNSPVLRKNMISHMASEISLVKKESITLITRAGDKQDTDYLKFLHHLGLNNGVLKYHFF